MLRASSKVRERHGKLAIFFVFLLAGHQVAGIASTAKLIQITAFWASRGPNFQNGVSAVRPSEIDFEMKKLTKAMNQFVEGNKHAQSFGGQTSQNRCCCKLLDLGESCAGKTERFTFRIPEGIICCKVRDRACNSWRSTLKTRVEEFEILDINLDNETINENCQRQVIGAQGQMLHRQNAFNIEDCTSAECAYRCNYADDCRDSRNRACPDNLLCKGTWKILCHWKLLGNEYMDTTNSGGLTKAGVGSVETVDALSVDVSALTEVLGEVGFLGPAGAFGGAISNILKLIDGVCKEGASFMGSCSGAVSTASVTFAIAALIIAFTGAGAVFAVIVGSIGVLVRKLGPEICKHGIHAWATHFFLGVPYDAIGPDQTFPAAAREYYDNMTAWMVEQLPRGSEFAAEVVTKIASAPFMILGFVLKLVISLVKHLALCIWTLVVAIPRDVYQAVKQWKRPIDKTCCAMRAHEAQKSAELMISQCEVGGADATSSEEFDADVVQAESPREISELLSGASSRELSFRGEE